MPVMRKLLPLLLCLLLTLSAAGCAQEDPKIPTPTQPSGPDIAQGFLPLDRHITISTRARTAVS